MVGVNFFLDLFSHSGLRAFFTSDFANCTTNYAPTIRCCSQHLMVGVNFFLTCSPILDLGHFSQVILPIVLQIMPPKNNPNHQVLFTASDGWGFFFDLFSHSGQIMGFSIWGYFFFLTCSPILDLFFTSDFANCTTNYAPTIRCCPQHLMVGVIFFFDLFSHSGLRAFFTYDFANCTTLCPNHQVLFTASDGWGFFFDLFSHSGLRAFFTSDFANCTTNYAPPKITPTIRCCSQHLMVGVNFFLTCSPILDLGHFSQGIFHKWFCQLYYKLCLPPKITPTIRCCSQHLMVGVNFFLTCSPILDLGHFSQVILPIVLQIMPQPSGAVHSIWWLGFFFWPVLPFWT